MKIVFVTPEKLEDDAFVAILQALDRAAVRRSTKRTASASGATTSGPPT